MFYGLKANQIEYISSPFDDEVLLLEEYKINFCRSIFDQLSGECIIKGFVNCKVINNSIDTRSNTNSLIIEIELDAELCPLYCNKHIEPCFISGTSFHHFTFSGNERKYLRIEYPFKLQDENLLIVSYQFGKDGLIIANMCLI